MFFDVETSGVIPEKHKVLTLAYIIYDDVKGEVLKKDLLTIKHEELVVNINALKINKINLLDHLKGMTESEVIEILNKDINTYNVKYLAGWNVKFDISFLNAMNKDKLYIPYKYIDVMQMFYFDKALLNHKLQNVAECYGVEHTPHDPISDINATLELFKIRRDPYDGKNKTKIN